MKLSILELVQVREGQNSAQAIAAMTEVARAADRLGFHRYWLAEHHNMRAVASTSPAVLAAVVAARTERIRVGSGGVMLPNHSPLVVAEQFALLEAAFPGRIDLGIGRAPGSDPVVTAVLNRSGATSDVNRFPQYVDEILGLLEAGGISVSLTNDREYDLRATPEAASVPPVWLLGSSDYSARLAAAGGLPYVFANHFAGGAADGPLRLYRSEFQPSAYAAEPLTFMTANVVAAETAEEAIERALPPMIQMARLRTNKPQAKVLSVEEAAAYRSDAHEAEIIAALRERWIIGDADTVATRLAELAASFGVDEVMVATAVGENRETPAETAPARSASLRLLAQRLLPEAAAL